jgi:hypothetical protein
VAGAAAGHILAPPSVNQMKMAALRGTISKIGPRPRTGLTDPLDPKRPGLDGNDCNF